MDIKYISDNNEWFDLNQCTIHFSEGCNLLFDNISEKWILNIDGNYKYIKEWKERNGSGVSDVRVMGCTFSYTHYNFWISYN